jgi:hypothetical protein
MKKAYSTPKMVVHGNFEVLTKAAGQRSLSDSIIINGKVVEVNDDSRDIVING